MKSLICFHFIYLESLVGLTVFAGGYRHKSLGGGGSLIVVLLCWRIAWVKGECK